MAPYFGLTSQTGPANPPLNRFRAVMRPTLSGLVLAPTRATDRGTSRASKLRMVMAPRDPPCSIGSGPQHQRLGSKHTQDALQCCQLGWLLLTRPGSSL